MELKHRGILLSWEPQLSSGTIKVWRASFRNEGRPNSWVFSRHISYSNRFYSWCWCYSTWWCSCHKHPQAGFSKKPSRNTQKLYSCHLSSISFKKPTGLTSFAMNTSKTVSRQPLERSVAKEQDNASSPTPRSQVTGRQSWGSMITRRNFLHSSHRNRWRLKVKGRSYLPLAN